MLSDGVTMAKDSKKKQVQDELMWLVKNGTYADKLPPERELARTLGVSRNLLREAVTSLASLGILEVRERQGIFINSPSTTSTTMEALQSLKLLPADFVAYQLEVRMIISVPATQLAALRRTEQDMHRLWDCFNSFISCPKHTVEEQIQNGKWEALLHHMVTEAAHNPILSRINESVNTMVERNNELLHPQVIHQVGWIEHIQKQHRLILEAVEAQNSDAAGAVLHQHLVDSVHMISEKYPHLISNLPHPYWDM